MSQTTIGWTPLLLTICIIITIGSTIPVGFFFGVLNTPSKIIQTWCNETLINEYESQLSDSQLNVLWASIVSIFQIGGICGSFGSAWCSDKYGRKGSLVISSVIYLTAGGLLAWCRTMKSLEMLITGRFLGGIASAIVFTAHPMYLMELAPPQLRGSVGVFTCIGVTLGIFVAQIATLPGTLGTDDLWSYALGSYTVLVLLSLLPFYWFPESPSWLYILKQEKDKAEAALKQLRGSGTVADLVVHQELESMEAESVFNATTPKQSTCSVLKDPELFLPLLLVCSFQMSQQLSGINAIFFYSNMILTQAGFSESLATWMNTGFGLFNVCMSLLGPMLLFKYARRPLMMLSSCGCALALFILSFALFYMDSLSWLPHICIFLFLVFVFFFQMGLGPIPYLIGSELLDVSPRPVAMSMGGLFSWIGNFLIGMCFPLLQSVWSSFAFLPCACVSICCCLLTWRYLPETRGRDPQELKQLMRNGLKSKIK